MALSLMQVTRAFVPGELVDGIGFDEGVFMFLKEEYMERAEAEAFIFLIREAFNEVFPEFVLYRTGIQYEEESTIFFAIPVINTQETIRN